MLHGKCRRRRAAQQASEGGGPPVLVAALLHQPAFNRGALIACRALAVVVYVVAILLDVCETVDSEHPWLLYYTNWTFVGFGVYAFYGLWCCFKADVRQVTATKPQRQQQDADPASDLMQAGGRSSDCGSSSSDAHDSATAAAAQRQRQRLLRAELEAVHADTGSSCSIASTSTGELASTADWAGPGAAAAAAAALPPAKRRCGECASCALSRWHWGDSAFLILFQTICAASVFLTIFYWLCVFEWETMAKSSPLKHGVSAALMLMDVMCSKLPVMWRHAQVVTLYGTSYMLVMWVNWGATGTWVYPVLDWTQPKSIYFYALLPTLLLLCYWVMWRLCLLRDSLVLAASAVRGSKSAAAQLRQLRQRVRLGQAWRRARQRVLRHLSGRGVSWALAMAAGPLALLLAAQRSKSSNLAA